MLATLTYLNGLHELEFTSEGTEAAVLRCRQLSSKDSIAMHTNSPTNSETPMMII